MPIDRRFPVLLPLLALGAMLLALAAGPPPASARDGGGGGGEVRVAGTCDRGATSKLRLRARDGGIRVQFEVDHSRSRASWRIVLVQDRRVVWRGRARAGSDGSLEIERRLRDLAGADRVSGRAWGPGGLTCSAGATLPG